ncbi:LPS-assembly lipoprotein LptE [Pseudoduganella violaceinigra]|uniref:LPS-assembly lipoprotein LptE n=1 Tax=Pseudoduganella violaceinigra TaxID=246602 RepID=UPI00040CB1B9|nr:LPS assembly lipoprotein LptE [Pseudoduganella violaceinigra]
MTTTLTSRGAVRRTWLALAALGVAAVASGCGFHLRGSGGSYTLPFNAMYVGLPESSPLAIDLKRNIRVNGHTSVVARAADADGVIEVLTNPEKTRTKSILSLNSNGRVREYLLSYNILFRVTDKDGKELLAPTQITLGRPLAFDESQLLAKEQEEALLYKDMQTDLVQQMMRRMAAIKPGAPATESAPSGVLPGVLVAPDTTR